MKRRNATFTVIALSVVLLAPASATALTAPFNVQAAKSVDGPYQDDSQAAAVDEGKSRLFFWRVEETDSVPDAMSFDDAATGDADDGYKVNWYKGKKPKKSKKISSEVEGAGYEFNLRADKTKYFTAKVVVESDAQALCLGGQASNDDPTFDQAYIDVNGPCF